MFVGSSVWLPSSQVSEPIKNNWQAAELDSALTPEDSSTSTLQPHTHKHTNRLSHYDDQDVLFWISESLRIRTLDQCKGQRKRNDSLPTPNRSVLELFLGLGKKSLDITNISYKECVTTTQPSSCIQQFKLSGCLAGQKYFQRSLCTLILIDHISWSAGLILKKICSIYKGHTYMFFYVILQKLAGKSQHCCSIIVVKIFS